MNRQSIDLDLSDSIERRIALAVDAIQQIAGVPVMLDAICRITQLKFSAVAYALDTEWVVCSLRDTINLGFTPGHRVPIVTLPCNEVVARSEPVLIDDLDHDPHYSEHAAAKLYGFRCYVSVPIRRSDGRIFGTLCALDQEPHSIPSDTGSLMGMFAALIAHQLDAQEQLEQSMNLLLSERKNAELREQFIAVLGHDLKNPLHAIHANAHALARLPVGERASTLVQQIRRSASRMADLIDDILDFASGRLGGGIPIRRRSDRPLMPALNGVIAELRAAYPNRSIEVSPLPDAFIANCDTERIAQLLSNLLANALEHGDAQSPVVLSMSVDSAGFAISVANSGPAIPPEIRGRLFEPFVHTTNDRHRRGLGLGLYIASEIARAHGGVLKFVSNEARTCFTFTMPFSKR